MAPERDNCPFPLSLPIKPGKKEELRKHSFLAIHSLAILQFLFNYLIFGWSNIYIYIYIYKYI